MSNVEYFGVRHLSPAGAFELKRRLKKVNPDLILVEGPSDLNEMMKWICDKKTKFPIAMLAYTNNTPVQSLLYPFAVYSPEIQAILWANENNVECRFMDLPSSTFLAFQDAEKKRRIRELQKAESKEDSELIEEKDEEESENSTTESIYKKLEIVTGEEHDSFWERNFEQLCGTGNYQEAVNIFGRELRSLSVDSKSETAETLVREAFMKRQIHDAIDSGKKNIFCVCGAFHVGGLETNQPMTDDELKKLPKLDSKATLMPYSYFRLSNHSGYGAGNKAPSYYQMLWNAFEYNKFSEFTEKYLVSVAKEHRLLGNVVSSAEVIEATRLAKTLANLRGSKYPTLDDLHESVITAMGHGEYGEFATAFVKVDLKSEIGKVPEGVYKTSIQDDFERQFDELDLKIFKKETAQTLELDLRENLRVKDEFKAFKDLYRSFFFNRLNVLGVSFAKGGQVSQQFGNWKEIWNLQWTPETEIEIVEASLLGETVSSATSFKLKELAKKATSIDESAEILEKAFECGLAECASYILTSLENLSVDDAAVYSIAKTSEKLSNIIRYGDLKKFDAEGLKPLLTKFFLRYCLILEESCICDGETVKKVIESMDIMSKVQLNHDFLNNKKEMFIQLMERISNRDNLDAKCSGFAMAILLERGEVDENLLATELSRRLSPGIPADLGASWFEGLSSKNHYSLIARLSLWRQLADYVSKLDDEEFKRVVVFLRRAFSDFSQNEKVEIAENLGELWQLNKSQVGEVLTKQLSEEETQKMNEELADFDFGDI